MAFVLEPPPHVFEEGIFVIPIPRIGVEEVRSLREFALWGLGSEDSRRELVEAGAVEDPFLKRVGGLGRCIDAGEVAPITPPLRKLHVPEGKDPIPL